ncbi:adenine phosphoribosyltransferase [Gulosibacter molinativorax]|uniref:Adenine phosphoribosyltransferase n=1 Tax=Gulosibacter molinativorax TaxID=256821 RepID=A0ABT7C534_9MICO|nr:adenine phosphoribosyltransferase [Gulosibacter molinativorax]QUY61727.1 Adenine phosphoribosyltransferase [Gulosibacter molinativorax]
MGAAPVDVRAQPELRIRNASQLESIALVTSPLEQAAARIVEIPDYPEPGVIFRDVMPLLSDAECLRTVVTAMLEPWGGKFDVVAGIEARGFLLAGAAATLANVGLVPIRKAGKLPRPAASVTYTLEYGTAEIEIQDDIAPGTRVLLMDDVLATGGTLGAAVELVRKIGAEPIGSTVLMELTELGGRAVVGDAHDVRSLFVN